DGIVLERLVNPDEFTRPDQAVMKLGIINTVLMAAKVTEEKIHSMQLGLSAEITFPAFPAETFQGKVFKIDPNTDPVTRTFTSYIEINNSGFRLKPGLSGFARIHRTAKDVLAVPSVAVINPSGDQASVFVVNGDGRADLRKVRLGVVVNAMTEVTGGLKEGEKVVTVVNYTLRKMTKPIPHPNLILGNSLAASLAALVLILPLRLPAGEIRARDPDLPRHPLTLKDCIAIALGESPKLEGSRFDLLAAGEEIRAAQASLWPNLKGAVTGDAFSGEPTSKFKIFSGTGVSPGKKVSLAG